MSELNWFANDGGPLIVLPREALPFWEGIAPPFGGRKVEAKFRWEDADAPATDYDRACDVEEYAAVVEVGPSWGVVLGGEEMNEAWLGAVAPDMCVLIRGWFDEEYTPDDIRTLCARLPEEQWKTLHTGLRVAQGDLLLMHAGSGGSWVREVAADAVAYIGDAVPYRAAPGLYAIACTEKTETEEADYLFVRFRRVGTG